MLHPDLIAMIARDRVELALQRADQDRRIGSLRRQRHVERTSVPAFARARRRRKERSRAAQR